MIKNLSIALIAVLITNKSVLAAPSTSLADTATPPANVDGDADDENVDLNIFLPTLGNTEESDRVMLKEISDRHVFEPQSTNESTSEPTIVSGNLSRQQPSAAADTNDLWTIIRQSEPMPLRITNAVEAQREQYLREAKWLNRTLERATPFLPLIIERLKARHLPLDLAFIPAVESGFRPDVISSGSASGLWQIIPGTAQEVGLIQNQWLDQRADLIHSTRAALDYLSYLNAEFHGDWELTLAAYNAGPGRVKAAIRKAEKTNVTVDFWALQLPEETRAYVPKITALISLIRQQPESLLKLPEITPDSKFALVDVGRRMSINTAAGLADVAEAELRNLNSGLSHGVTPPDGPHHLMIPVDALERFKKRLATAKTPDLLPVPKTHTVQKGDSVSSIALQYGIRQQTLKNLNKITGDKILLGQVLQLDQIKRHNAVNHPANSSTRSPANSPDSTRAGAADLLSYTIRQGDTLSEIARRFNVDMADISFLGGASPRDQLLIPGKKLKIEIKPADGNS